MIQCHNSMGEAQNTFGIIQVLCDTLTHTQKYKMYCG